MPYVCMCIYVCVFCVFVYIYIYIYIYSLHGLFSDSHHICGKKRERFLFSNTFDRLILTEARFSDLV